MAKIRVTYWDDIPVSVLVKDAEGNKGAVELPKMYMITVDAVATKKGLTGSREYTKLFRFETEEREGNPEELAKSIADELEGKYPRAWLKERRFAAGVSEDSIAGD